MRRKVAGGVVREHKHSPNLSSPQDVSVEKAQSEMSCVSVTQKHRRLQDTGQVPGTTVSPGAAAKGTGTVAWCPLLEDHVSLDHLWGLSTGQWRIDDIFRGLTVLSPRSEESGSPFALPWHNQGEQGGLKVPGMGFTPSNYRLHLQFLDISIPENCIRSLNCCTLCL